MEGTYVTLIPAFHYSDQDEANAGLVFGFEHMEAIPEVVGLVPVIVEEPMRTWFLPDQVRQRWRDYFQWLFVVSQPEKLMDFTGSYPKNENLASAIKEVVTEGELRYNKQYGKGLTRFVRLFEQYLLGTRVLPRKVRKSPCRKCAKDGGWTLTIAWALWDENNSTSMGRWDPVWPSNVETSQATATHPRDFDDVIDLLAEFWLEHRAANEHMVHNASSIDYFEAVSNDDSGELDMLIQTAWMDDVIGTAHRKLWYPPEWLLPKFKEELDRSSERVVNKNQLVNSIINTNIVPDPYYTWELGVMKEIEKRREEAYGS